SFLNTALRRLARKADAEYASPTDFALDADRPPGVANDAVTGRQRQPGAAPHRFGREKGLENPRQVGFVDAAPLIFDGNLHGAVVGPRPQGDGRPPVAGLNRIQEQAVKHLADLSRMAQHRPY